MMRAVVVVVAEKRRMAKRDGTRVVMLTVLSIHRPDVSVRMVDESMVGTVVIE